MSYPKITETGVEFSKAFREVWNAEIPKDSESQQISFPEIRGTMLAQWIGFAALFAALLSGIL